MSKIFSLVLASSLLALAACTPANPAAPAPGASPAASTPAAGASASPVAASPAAEAPFGLRFLVDGKATSKADKAYVPTFSDSKLALTFGQQTLEAPGDYVLFLTFRLDAAKAATGTYDRSAVVAYEALMRENTTGPTYTARSLNPTQLAAADFTLQVADGKISATYKGEMAQAGGDAKRTVEVAVSGMPKDKR